MICMAMKGDNGRLTGRERGYTLVEALVAATLFGLLSVLLSTALGPLGQATMGLRDRARDAGELRLAVEYLLMALGTSKAIIAIGSVTAMALFYDEAIAVAKGLVDKTRFTVTSAELSQFDRRLVAQWDMRGAPPREIPGFLRKEFYSAGGKDSLSDSWGRPYVFENLSDGYLLLSKGPDGTRSTADDVFIQRQGRHVRSQLRWVEDPDEIVLPMKDLAKKQMRLTEERLHHETEKASDVERILRELDIEGTLENFRAARTSKFVPTGEGRREGTQPPDDLPPFPALDDL